jgi:hypothetical protein
VSLQQLNDGMNSAISAAVDNSSANTNGVATLNLTASDPPTPADVQSIADKLDELILALRR